MTATRYSTRYSTRQTAYTEPPGSVRTATNILYVLIALGLIGPIAFLAVTALSLARGNVAVPDGELMFLLVTAGVSVVVGWFCLMLTRKARRGRRWAWKSLLLVLGLVAFVGALVMTAISDGAAIGLAMLAVPLVLIGLLLGRRARAYYARPRTFY
jgi:hypothetical protein